MLSRALSLATVMLLVGCLTAAWRGGENLEAGKTPSQIFAGTCNACHKSPRGLLKNVPASSLPGFLRQHYTTSSDMAGVLASFLVSNGATDTRFQSKDQPKTDAAKGAKQEAARPDQLDRFGRRQQPAARARGGQAGRRRDHAARPARTRGRNAKRLARPSRRCRQARRWPDAGAGRDRQQNGRQAEARQARQAAEEPPKPTKRPRKRRQARDRQGGCRGEKPEPPSRRARARLTRASPKQASLRRQV